MLRSQLGMFNNSLLVTAALQLRSVGKQSPALAFHNVDKYTYQPWTK